MTGSETRPLLAILSNELDLFYGADFREKLPFLADFDVIVDAMFKQRFVFVLIVIETS